MALIPKADEEFLQEKQFDYELTQAGAEIHLVLRQYSFPPAYASVKADVLIVIPPAYPMAALDMFWTHPDVKLANGAWPQASENHETKSNGRNWQRWSRHIEWRSGVDTLRSFITAMVAEISKGI
jgi:hypothetical protein